MRNVDNINIIKLHPIKDSEYFLIIHEMRKVDIDEWIIKHYPKSKENKTTDSEWSWKTMYYHIILQNSRGQNIKGYVYRINGEIYGMSIVSYHYPCILDTKLTSAIESYLWYMVKSQNSTKNLKDVDINPKYIKLQKYVYDIIYDEIKKKPLKSSLKTFWLHADPNGKDKLLDTYKRKGFILCPLVQEKVWQIRKDDGRYLYLPETKFSKLSIPTIGDDDGRI